MRPPDHVPWPLAMLAAERRVWNGLRLTGLTDDSRSVRPGYVFVARRGLSLDGHAFVAEAAARGAALLVAEREVAVPLPCCLIPDGRRGLSRLAAAWFGHPSRRLLVAGVTGTNGKTTTTWWLAAILRAAGLPACLLGTAGAVLGHRRRRLAWTTPPPVDLQRLLAEALGAGARAAVLEVSAQALSQHRVDDCAFDAAGITNLSREHGECYPDASAYRDAKLELFRLLERQGKRGQAVLNAGLVDLELFRRACGTVPVSTYGAGGDVEALGVRTGAATAIDLRLPGAPGAVPVRLHVPGGYNVDNALCAAALAIALGVPADAVTAGLSRLRSVPGRLQTIRRRPFRVIVDYAHNPAGLRALLGYLRPLVAGRLMLVIGARGGRERGKRELMGAVAAAFCDHVTLTADRPAGEDPLEAVRPMRQAVSDIGVPVDCEPDRRLALEGALERARAGDCIVVAGKGDEPWGEDDSSTPGDNNDIAVLRRLLGGPVGMAVDRPR